MFESRFEILFHHDCANVLDAGTVGMTFQVEKLRYYFSSQMSFDSFFPEIEISWKKCKSLKWLFESSSAMYI